MDSKSDPFHINQCLQNRINKEDYVLKQIELCDLNDRIQVLRMIVSAIGLAEIQIIPEGSMIMMDKINDVLLDCLVAFLKEREKQCQIDFSDVKTT